MATFIIRRVLWTVLVMFVITVVVFVIFFKTPGVDPARAIAGRSPNAQILDEIRAQFGLNRPLPVQYALMMKSIFVSRDLVSYSNQGVRVVPEIAAATPATLSLVFGAALIWVVMAIAIGIAAAMLKGTVFDPLLMVVALIGVSTPIFWLGIVAIFVFYARLGWAPPPGRLSMNILPPPPVTGFVAIDALLAHRLDAAFDALSHLALPALVLSSYSVGVVTRMMRGSMLEVLGEDYVRTAHAKGLSARAVVVGHAARNSLIPVLTIVGLSFGGLLSGAVVTETVFAWPGLGSYAFRSATALDFPAIMGVGLVVATIYMLVNLVVDSAYAFVDPRIRVG